MYRKRKLNTLFAMLITAVFTLSLFSNTVQAKGTGSRNSAPIILQTSPVSITTNEDQTSAPLTLSATDTNGDTLSWSISSAPVNGTATISTVSSSRGKSTVNVTYKPKANINGIDSFVVRVSDGKGGTASINAAVSINPINDNPVNTAAPSISGTATAGSTLTANNGTWTDDSQGPLTFLYQWQEAADAQGTGKIDLSGAAEGTYLLTVNDNGKYIRVMVTASDGSLSSSAYSPWLLVPAKIINYVALGDSIATGTIYSGNKITSYVTNFYNYLKGQNLTAQVNLTNFAHDGDDTNDLLAKLQDQFIVAVTNANIITISIGGNNLMQAAKDSTSLTGYNFNKIDAAVAEQGVRDFNAQFELIINKIKDLNRNAQVIVTTVYNPYNEVSDAALHNQVDSYLSRTDTATGEATGINDVINKNSGSGYSIADVYKDFHDSYSNNMGAVTYFYPTNLWDMITRNPHPNATGQGRITQLHQRVYIPQ